MFQIKKNHQNEKKIHFSQLKSLIQTAKFNIENHYSVVGITHHMKLTFLLFEYYLPRFFDNAMSVYKDMESKQSEKIFDNKNPYRYTTDMGRLIYNFHTVNDI